MNSRDNATANHLDSIKSDSVYRHKDGFISNESIINSFSSMANGTFNFPKSPLEEQEEKILDAKSEKFKTEEDGAANEENVVDALQGLYSSGLTDIPTLNADNSKDNNSNVSLDIVSLSEKFQIQCNAIARSLDGIGKKLDSLASRIVSEEKDTEVNDHNTLKSASFTPVDLPIDFDFQYNSVYKTPYILLFFIPFKSFKFTIRQLTAVKLNCEDFPPDYDVLLPGPAFDLAKEQISILSFICPPQTEE